MKITHNSCPELHACLCFFALPHRDKLTYLEPRFPRQVFEWGLGWIETDDPLCVVALIASEECGRRFQNEAADESLGGISACIELMSCDDAFAVWAAPERWGEDDCTSLGCLDISNGLRQLALVALRALDWPIEKPPLSCRALLEKASPGQFIA